MRPQSKLPASCLYSFALLFLFALGPQALAQEAQQKPAEKPAAKSSEKAAPPENAQNPAQIDLLETKVRFETSGDSRKEVHALVKINSELGVRQFARLNFDFNRSFESVEIRLVRITHPSGGTADILPGAITDQPNPAVVNAPAYQDVRVKSVRILGLQPGDTLEYRVVKTVSHHPLAPDFWLDHTFDRTGVVSREILEIDLPASLRPKIQINSATPVTTIENSGEGEARRSVYRWQRAVAGNKRDEETKTKTHDVMLTTLLDWDTLSIRLAESLQPSGPRSGGQTEPSEVEQEAKALSQGVRSQREKIEAIYTFVSEKISTVDLPLGSTGFVGRPPGEILKSRYAIAEDKFVLFDALAHAVADDSQSGWPLIAEPDLMGPEESTANTPPRPSPFDHLLIGMAFGSDNSVYWLDPGLEVAPFNMVPPTYRGRDAFVVARRVPRSDVISGPWETIPDRLPFAASQKVEVSGSLAEDGKLSAKIRYSMRGDNELLLRVTFHQSPREKWKELAQLLSITDGFRGQVTRVEASDPYATKEPFTLEYEIEQPKFVSWSKKTVRIPALLPQIGLPDPPAKPAAGAAVSPVDLGTPLEVETHMTLRLPAGTAAHAPTGTSVQRDYATYASQYAVKGQTITASRHIQFLLREVPATRAVDYIAFLRAVQNDEAQDFTLEQANPAPPAEKPAGVKTQTPNKTEQPKP